MQDDPLYSPYNDQNSLTLVDQTKASTGYGTGQRSNNPSPELKRKAVYDFMNTGNRTSALGSGCDLDYCLHIDGA